MKSKCLLVVLSALAAIAVRAAGPWGDADHILFIKLDATPVVADVYTLPEGNGEPVLIGHTPMTIPVELTWGTSFRRKSWSKLTVSSLGNVVTSTYSPTNKTHEINIALAVKKAGYSTQLITNTVAVLRRPKDLEWDDVMDYLPKEATLHADLTKVDADGQPAVADIRTVVVASGGSLDALGDLLIRGPAAADVRVDGKPVGRLPVRLMIPAGDHLVEIPGVSPPFSQNVKVVRGATTGVAIP
jgi:hypothetical protein